MEVPTLVDLRSDTVTTPTSEMKSAMLACDLGDDVLDGDPTARNLEEKIAAICGKDSAIFMPSGTMTNQIAVRNHCQRGDELLCEAGCHIFNYEQAGFAQLSSVSARAIHGVHGILTPDLLAPHVHGDDDHLPRTSLVAIENTHNRAGGVVQPLENIAAISDWARGRGLALHLDGARLFNAVAATGTPASAWCEYFDSISICFSKGLGAPVGSALIGSHNFIRQARRARKLFGGGMRQMGLLAAAATFALDHHRERLAEDHRHARQLAEAAATRPFISLPSPPQTNIVLLEISPNWGNSAQLVEILKQQGIAALPFGQQYVRLVTHLNLSSDQIDHACQILAEVDTLQPNDSPAL